MFRYGGKCNSAKLEWLIKHVVTQHSSATSPIACHNVPYVNVQITKTGVTRENKAQIVKEITSTLERVLGKKPEHIHIVIDLVDEENWGFAGMLTTDYRKAEDEG